MVYPAKDESRSRSVYIFFFKVRNKTPFFFQNSLSARDIFLAFDVHFKYYVRLADDEVFIELIVSLKFGTALLVPFTKTQKIQCLCRLQMPKNGKK